MPFLDHHVAEYVAGLPIRHKIRGTREKYVLREAVRGVITPEVYNRHKHPFVAPPPRSSNDALSTFCQDVLRSPQLNDQPFFEPARVRSMMDYIDPDDSIPAPGGLKRRYLPRGTFLSAWTRIDDDHPCLAMDRDRFELLEACR